LHLIGFIYPGKPFGIPAVIRLNSRSLLSRNSPGKSDQNKNQGSISAGDGRYRPSQPPAITGPIGERDQLSPVRYNYDLAAAYAFKGDRKKAYENLKRMDHNTCNPFMVVTLFKI
jgi:hypothetical protein